MCPFSPPPRFFFAKAHSECGLVYCNYQLAPTWLSPQLVVSLCKSMPCSNYRALMKDCSHPSNASLICSCMSIDFNHDKGCMIHYSVLKIKDDHDVTFFCQKLQDPFLLFPSSKHSNCAIQLTVETPKLDSCEGPVMKVKSSMGRTACHQPCGTNTNIPGLKHQNFILA